MVIAARPPTRPVRVHETDHATLRALTLLEGRLPAEILHEALREYVRQRGPELSNRFRAAQQAIASGDVDAVVSLLSEGAESRVRALEAEMKSLR